jgi:uncharacterized protein (TIGR00725 family)
VFQKTAIKSNHETMNNISQVTVIGSSASSCTEAMYEFGVQLGKALADLDLTVITGGRNGVMEAVLKGVHQSEHYRKGMAIGITPTLDKADANEFCDVIIPTTIGYTRNSIMANSGDVIIALGGSAGTLSEMAFAWSWGKPLLGVVGFGGWSEKLAGTAIDHRRDDVVVAVKSIKEIVEYIKSLQ